MLLLSRLSASSSSSSRSPPNSNSSTSRMRRCSIEVRRIECPPPFSVGCSYFGMPVPALRPLLEYSHIRYKKTNIRLRTGAGDTEVDEEGEGEDDEDVRDVVDVRRYKQSNLLFV